MQEFNDYQFSGIQALETDSEPYNQSFKVSLPEPPVSAPKNGTKKISLALQGGGAHGAFTWGVLETLLQDERVNIEAISGTSAGAMNALMVAYGTATGGRKGAIDLLAKFWKRTSEQQRFSILQPSLIDRKLGNGRLDYSPAYHLFDFYSLLFSPYQFNPTDFNPLRDTLLELVDFDRLKAEGKMKIFVSATNVRTSRAKVFTREEITVDSVLASACLPYLFKAVEIEGEHYWDGGYMGNPPIFPLIDEAETADILLIQINPIVTEKVPKTSDEIRDRVNTLSFNSSLMHEMRRVNFVQRMLADGYDMNGILRNLYIHNINPEVALGQLNVSSKLNVDWKFLNQLRALGHAMAKDWLRDNFEFIGQKSTCDVKESFL